MKRAARTLAAVMVLAVGVVAVGAIGPWRDVAEPIASEHTGISALAVRTPTTSIDAQIQALQRRLREEPGDASAMATLGFAYVQQARITADPTWYAKAEQAIEAAAALDPSGERLETLIAEGTLALARHDFPGALAIAQRARSLDPYSAIVRGIAGDALLELGRYEEADDAFQAMIDLRPDLSSWARVSYARELQGDVAGATAAMRTAVELAPSPADEAWASFHVGELYWRHGQRSRAVQWYQRSRALDDAFVPAQGGLAKAAWARGETRGAIRRYEAIVARQPLPEYLIALGELYGSVGRADLAVRQWSVVRASQQLAASNGVNVDLELALFDADHGDARSGVKAARAEWERRRSVYVADALAWSLRQAGRPHQAWRYAAEAMRLGTRDASILFHAGMIRRDLGDRSGGERLIREAVSINPSFSIIYSSVASRLLGIGAGR